MAKKSPLGIVKRDEFEFDQWLKERYAKAASKLEDLGINPSDVLATELGWLMCLPKFKGKLLAFEGFQIAFLLNRSEFRIMNKARQIGFSFVISGEALSRCHIKERHRAICVSYNLDDAKDKVEKAKELHDELPLEFQKTIVIDKKTEVGFRSNSSHRKISTIVSMPSKAPRGKTGDVYLDEFGHCGNADAIYQGATALIIRSGGQISIGSSPMGQRGKFYEIFVGGPNGDKYEKYWRQNVPWWLNRIYCTNVREAAEFAYTMSTEERVQRYGTQKLIDQFSVNSLEDFQQEFECSFQDERVSFYPYDIIFPCAHKNREEILFDSAESLAGAASKMDALSLGYDVGRTGHPSELMVCEEHEKVAYTLRYNEQMRDMKFPDQRARLTQIMDMIHAHVRVFRIDSTGLGRDLAESLQANPVWGRKVVLVEFSLASKTALANSFKILLEEKQLTIYNDKDLIGQIHSVKKKYTAAGNEVFDTEKNKKSHADKFWSLALATYRKRKRGSKPAVLNVRTATGKETPDQGVSEGREKSYVEKLFSLNEETEEDKRAAQVLETAELQSHSKAQLERMAEECLLAHKVYERDGMIEEAKGAMSRYKRIKRIVLKRRDKKSGIASV